MRLRDKWFPENTYRRYYLRKFNNILHGRFFVLKEKNYIRASKPRLTERWFPEGTLIRKILRKLNPIFNKNSFFTKSEKSFNNIFETDLDKAYKIWRDLNIPTEKELESQRKVKFKINPKISVIVPMYNIPIKFFEELVQYMQKQTYSKWELCLADGSPRINKRIVDICKKDKRIKYKFIGENLGISGNTNEALKLVTGEYIGLLDHDDILAENALFEVVKCINENPKVEFIYTDEDKFSKINKNFTCPHFKPDFAIDTLRSNNYICHFSVFKKELMDKLGGFRSKYDGSQDYDIILRMSEHTDKIIHISKPLYHWRVHSNSTSKEAQIKPYIYNAAKMAIEDHLLRVGLKGTVTINRRLGTYNVDYDVQGNPKVSIIIPNCNQKDTLKTCIDSILKLTTYKNYEIIIIENNSKEKSIFDYYKILEKNSKIRIVYYKGKGFNYSKIINFGVKNSEGDYIVQLNNDTQLITPNWLEKMLGFCQRENVGAVGVKLYYPDNTIQHAGVVIGLNGVAGHIFRGRQFEDYGYFGRTGFIQNLSAVTAACIMTKKEIYEEINYMYEGLAVAFNDIDFCLKIREKGYLIIYNPTVEIKHYESKSRGINDTKVKQKKFLKEIEIFQGRWKNILKKGDPYYNKNLSYDTEQSYITLKKIED